MSAVPNGNVSVQTWISGATLVISLGAAFWYFSAQLTSLTGSTQVSLANGQNTAVRIATLEADVATRRIEIARLQSALVEVETQFCSLIEFDNVQHARDQRDFAIVFEKVMGQQYALANSFFRQCNRPPTP